MGTINYMPLVPWLMHKASNVYTQFGEDGLIAACLERVGITNRHCFEIGAADGKFFSNTLRLREDEWFAVLIESDASQFEKLETNYGHQSTCIHQQCIDLDSTLGTTEIDTTPDLGIIDIDGQDWHLWDRMKVYRPRVMLVEIAVNIPEASVPRLGGPGQAGLNAIEQLGASKGYRLVATTVCNALFVSSELL